MAVPRKTFSNDFVHLTVGVILGNLLSGEDTFIGCSAKNNPAYRVDFMAKMDARWKRCSAAGNWQKSWWTTCGKAGVKSLTPRAFHKSANLLG